MWEARSRWSRTSTQWWEIGLFTTTEPGLDRPDLMMHYGSVPFDMNTLRLGLPDDRERLLPDAERLPRALARHRAPAHRATSATARASTRATSPTPRATTSG